MPNADVTNPAAVSRSSRSLKEMMAKIEQWIASQGLPESACSDTSEDSTTDGVVQPDLQELQCSDEYSSISVVDQGTGFRWVYFTAYQYVLTDLSVLD